MLLNSSSDQLSLRPFGVQDIVAAQALSNAVGWPLRLEDWCWLASLGKGVSATRHGRVVGTTLHWDYGDGVSSVGAVLVHPDLQGLGIGRQMMNACLTSLRGRSIILYATEAGRPLYERLGFAKESMVTRFQGEVTGNPTSFLPPDARLCPLKGHLEEAVIQLAERGSGLRRSTLVKSLIAESEGIVLVENGLAVGFSLFRRYGRGWVIGPVVAKTEISARVLINHWLRLSSSRFVRIDVTSNVTQLLQSWLSSVGLNEGSAAVSMVYGKWPSPDSVVRQFAITTQATA